MLNQLLVSIAWSQLHDLLFVIVWCIVLGCHNCCLKVSSMQGIPWTFCSFSSSSRLDWCKICKRHSDKRKDHYFSPLLLVLTISSAEYSAMHKSAKISLSCWSSWSVIIVAQNTSLEKFQRKKHKDYSHCCDFPTFTKSSNLFLIFLCINPFVHCNNHFIRTKVWNCCHGNW